jgi:hypothetical protein
MTGGGERNGDHEGEPIPPHLRHWPGLSVREGGRIVAAPPDDVAVAKGYPTAADKGTVVGGKRLTLLTAKLRYTPGEEVRVIHVLEAVEPGGEIFVMGPKRIYGEYVDGVPVTPESAPETVYDGPVLETPNVDYNYEITSYRFARPGRHRIHWQMGPVRSNTLEIEVVPDNQTSR